MAVRLNVLILRPTGGGSSWHAHCDDLLGHVLGRPGIDVTLLERLPIAGEESTEMLALESIGGHAACLAWEAPQKVLEDLDRAGRPMTRRPHAGDPGAGHDDKSAAEPAANSSLSGNSAANSSHAESTNGDRRRGRMYFFDMRQNQNAAEVLDSLLSLLKTLQVPTFQIGGSTPILAAPASPSPANPAAAKTAAPAPVTSEPAAPKPAAHSVDSSEADVKPAAPATSPNRSSATASERSTSDELDRLVDQLDELDI